MLVNSLGLHQLLTLEVLVSLVCSSNPSAVDAPTLLGVVALLGPEFTIGLTVGVVDAVVVNKGGLHRLSSDVGTGVQLVPGSVHFCLHQVTLGNH